MMYRLCGNRIRDSRRFVRVIYTARTMPTEISKSLAAVLFTVSSIVCCQEPVPGEGWVSLFNGKNLNGWHNINGAPSTWTVRDGKIFCSGKPTCILRTDRHYENFVLELEWRHLRPKGNAGVFVWSDPVTAKGKPFTRAIEIQVLDGRESSRYTSDGDVFPIHGATMRPENHRAGSRAFPTEKRSKPSPEWNHYSITCQDGSVSLALNGKVVTRGHDCSPRKGYIALESEGSPIEFRNLRVKELPPAVKRLKPEQISDLDEGFVSLYNGLDFTGWKHGEEHAGHWKAAGWRINSDGEGGHLWSEREFGDFVLICDWRWTGKPKKEDRPVILANGEYALDGDGARRTQSVDDAGDSGIYLRGNNKSQINIWCWPIGSGEVYGYRNNAKQPPEVRAGVTPRVKADAPIGKWNRFVITMKGELLTVVLNGETVIEEARLPGVPARGPIALQKHGAPIQFANIYIKELD